MTARFDFAGALAILFIALKLTGVIHWSWLWVLAPIWIPFAIFLAFAVIAFVLALIAAWWSSTFL